MSADTRGLPSVVDVLSEVINRPSILPEEVCVELYATNIYFIVFDLTRSGINDLPHLRRARQPSHLVFRKNNETFIFIL
jgi:hypothetical protein